MMFNYYDYPNNNFYLLFFLIIVIILQKHTYIYLIIIK